MPLLKGSSKAIVGENIREMMKSGRPQAQAVAASLRMAGVGKKKMKKIMPMPSDDDGDEMDMAGK